MINSEDSIIILRLLTTSGVGTRTVSRIVNDISFRKVNIGDIPKLTEYELMKRYKLELKAVKAFLTGNELANQLWNNIRKEGIDIVLKGDEEYPVHLTNALHDDAPPVLFYKGNIGLLKKRGVGFCGSRKASERGLSITRKCANILAEEGINVVSGYAFGVDQSAHIGALENGGTTTIVLAEGILNFQSKAGIRDLITEQNALIISEFSPKLPWQVRQAMSRNRTIIGISNAMILVESDEKGGTFAAGQTTIEYHRPLFVIDYETPPVSAKGNPFFIQRGAMRIRQNSEGRPNLDDVIKIVASEHNNGNLRGPRERNFFIEDTINFDEVRKLKRMTKRIHIGLVLELDMAISVLLEKKLICPSLIQIYSAIDILGWLISEDDISNRDSFLKWCEKYLMIDPRIQCSAMDLYGARCGIIHSYNPSSSLSKKDKQTQIAKAKQIAYAWGNVSKDDLTKIKDPRKDNEFAEIHINELHDALRKGMLLFIKDIEEDDNLLSRVIDKAKRFFINVSPVDLNTVLKILESKKIEDRGQSFT
jgi:DNA processing protein